MDTNVLVAAITDEEGSAAVAAELLSSEHELLTSLLNFMELRTVLTKKERMEMDRARAIQDEVTSGVDVVIHDTSDMLDANAIQRSPCSIRSTH